MVARHPATPSRNPFKRVAERVSPRGWGLLLIGGFGSIGRGLAYGWLDDVVAQLAWVERLMPLDAYAVIWIGAGILSIVTVVLGQTSAATWSTRVLLPWAVGAVVFLNGLWGLSFLLSWLFEDQDRAWVSTLSYAQIAIGMAIIGQMIDPPDVEPVDADEPPVSEV